ncbi:hypothetical protein L1887_22025 [Cichorium endivia]|nr:hypothetical protein L1887_22025 [Cichorium endivia]
MMASRCLFTVDVLFDSFLHLTAFIFFFFTFLFFSSFFNSLLCCCWKRLVIFCLQSYSLKDGSRALSKDTNTKRSG